MDVVFFVDECCCKFDKVGPCRGNERSDNTDVIFVSIGKVNRKKKKRTKTFSTRISRQIRIITKFRW